MAQRVEFATFPGSPEALLLDRAVEILSFQERDKADFKGLRGFLRERGLWDKEASPVALEVIGLDGAREGGALRLRATARALLAAPDEAGRRKALFDALLRDNTLLVKFTLEALDTEREGRLHSTHELYRYLTSYAYPGAYIRLPDFQAFVRWMQAAGAIRTIGIRWGLDENGRAALARLAGLDVEEILEDEALAAEEGAAAGEEDDEAEEDLPDAPPEPPRPAPPVAAPPPASPAPALDVAGRQASIRLLRERWLASGRPAGPGAGALGLDTASFAQDPAAAARLATAALLATTERTPGDEAALAALVSLNERLAAQPAAAAETMRRAAAAGSGAELVRELHEGLFGAAAPLAPFWIVGELLRLGVWEGAKSASVAVVPSFAVRVSAFRLGLLDSFYAEDFAALVGASQVLSRFFDAEVGFSAPLDRMAGLFGCRWRCPNVARCPLACRERRSL